MMDRSSSEDCKIQAKSICDECFKKICEFFPSDKRVHVAIVKRATDPNAVQVFMPPGKFKD